MSIQKKAGTFVLVALLFSLLSLHALAAPPAETLVEQHTETFADGSYVVVSTFESQGYGRASGTVTGRRDYSYYDGGLAWVYTVRGTFSYTGSSAECVSASDSYTIHNNAWCCAGSSAYASGNTAYANGTMRRGSDGREIYPSVSLSCSANGALY